MQLLDRIETEDGTMYGVIDYASTKYVVFYDVTQNEDPIIRRVILIWRMYFSHIRFSMFKETYFPMIKIAYPKMLNKKTIKNPQDYDRFKPKRKVEKRTVSPLDI